MTDLTPSSRPPLWAGLKTACNVAAGRCCGSGGGTKHPPRFGRPDGRPCRSISCHRRAPFAAHGQCAGPARRARLSFMERIDGLAKTSAGALGCPVECLVGSATKKMVGAFAKFQPVVRHRAITLHSRMSDWVSLSPQQRNLARLNFNKLQSLPKEDKKAKWEAYQALSQEEKRLLSAASMPPAKMQPQPPSLCRHTAWLKRPCAPWPKNAHPVQRSTAKPCCRVRPLWPRPLP